MTNPFKAQRSFRLAPPEPIAGRKVRVLAFVHKYPPLHNAGAEWMLHTINRWLIEHDFEVVVFARDVADEYEFEGIPVFPGWKDSFLREPFEWCDIAITHLDVTPQAIAWARNGRRPLVHLIHNHRQLEYNKVGARSAQLVVWNSAWTQKLFKHWPGESMLMRPPVFASDYKTERGNCYTLMNLNSEKGGKIFWQIVKRFPDAKFLAVKGAYGGQVIPPKIPDNVEVIKNTPDARDDIYAKTRILLMPSRYESWGRTGVEAMASGIPVIAHPTPGLVESLGDAGVFADKDDLDAWVEAINEVENNYRDYSQKAFDRSAQLDPTPELKEFCGRITRIATKWNKKGPSWGDSTQRRQFGQHSAKHVLRAEDYH